MRRRQTALSTSCFSTPRVGAYHRELHLSGTDCSDLPGGAIVGRSVSLAHYSAGASPHLASGLTACGAEGREPSGNATFVRRPTNVSIVPKRHTRSGCVRPQSDGYVRQGGGVARIAFRLQWVRSLVLELLLELFLDAAQFLNRGSDVRTIDDIDLNAIAGA